MKKKIVYIAHPIGGDVEGNIKSVLKIVRELSIKNQVIPFAPYIVDVQALDDTDLEQRAIGFYHNWIHFHHGIIDEVWLYGQRVSDGMITEIGWAKELGIPVISKSEGTKTW